MKKIIKFLKGEPQAVPSTLAASFYRDLEVDVLARTLWGEARGEGDMGMEAVANVIINRVRVAQARGGYWWGDTIIAVCQKPYQFSCWNRSDANYKKLQEVTEKTDVYFATAMRIARRAVAGTLADQTGGATHYHARSITPNWAVGQNPTKQIGHHLFYALVEGV